MSSITTVLDSKQAVDQFLANRPESLSEREAVEIGEYIKANLPKWEQMRAQQAHFEGIYLHSKETKLARSIEVLADGMVFIHFNRSKRGDQILGNGSFKRATRTYNFFTGEMCARLSNSLRDPPKKRRELAESEEFISLFLSETEGEGIAKTYYVTRYADKAGYQKMGIIQRLYSRDLYWALQENELSINHRITITRKLLSGISQMQKHRIKHDDLSLANILIGPIPDEDSSEEIEAVIIDFGSSKQFNEAGFDCSETADVIELLLCLWS